MKPKLNILRNIKPKKCHTCRFGTTRWILEPVMCGETCSDYFKLKIQYEDKWYDSGLEIGEIKRGSFSEYNKLAIKLFEEIEAIKSKPRTKADLCKVRVDKKKKLLKSNKNKQNKMSGHETENDLEKEQAQISLDYTMDLVFNKEHRGYDSVDLFHATSIFSSVLIDLMMTRFAKDKLPLKIACEQAEKTGKIIRELVLQCTDIDMHNGIIGHVTGCNRL